MTKSKPLAIDLFAGLGGWSHGLLAEGWDCIGFDIEQHVYGDHRYPAQLVVQDVLTLHGSQFRNADLIVASPPCQEYSWMAMPWSRAKAHAAEIRADTTGAELARLNRLFNACFRIQREACEAAGRHIPMVVENVKGAQPWVGRARWMFGSFALWGDVPALMPITGRRSHMKCPNESWSPSRPSYTKDHAWKDEATKNNGGSWFNVAHNTTSGKGRNPDGRNPKCDCQHPETTPAGFAAVSVNCPVHGNVGPTLCTTFPSARSGGADPMWRRGFQATAADQLQAEGVKQRGSGAAWFDEALNERRRNATAAGMKTGNRWFGDGNERSPMRQHNSKSNARKMACAMIAKIPEPLSRHIARTFKPR